MFNVDSIEDFHKHYQSDDDCKEYLFNLKWQDGFTCTKCGHTKSWKGRTKFHKRCAGCGYDESSTANTLFHKIRLPLLKAFGIAFQIVDLKKGRSTVDFAREFRVMQPTVWYFKNKLQKAMSADDQIEPECDKERSKFSLDGLIITHRGRGLNGLQRVDVDLVVGDNKKNLKFISSYCILPNEDNLETCRLVNGKFKEFKTSILLWNFKVWLTGIHHHCSFTHLKGYLDEFFFKYNYRDRRAELWHRLLQNAIKIKPASTRSRALTI